MIIKKAQFLCAVVTGADGVERSAISRDFGASAAIQVLGVAAEEGQVWVEVMAEAEAMAAITEVYSPAGDIVEWEEETE